jgi:hypothetical protein
MVALTGKSQFVENPLLWYQNLNPFFYRYIVLNRLRIKSSGAKRLMTDKKITLHALSPHTLEGGNMIILHVFSPRLLKFYQATNKGYSRGSF